MKLICLNAWGGKRLGPLLNFIKESAETTDIFCFQEVFNSSKKEISPNGRVLDLYDQISDALPDFRGHFSASESGYNFGDLSTVTADVGWGLAVFVRWPILTIRTESFLVHKTKNGGVENKFERPRILQRTELKISSDEIINLFNFHGLLDGGAKTDTPARDSQFSSVRKIIYQYKGRKILCGDFNIRPDTKNIVLLGKSMIDLIKKYNIPATRNRLYGGMKKYSDFISDYVFVSEDVNVESFGTLDVEVSDHLPLILDFE